MSTFTSFASWSDVLAAAKAGEQLWYHAPLDLSPYSVMILRVFKNGKIRLSSWSRGASSFTADAGHLSRFRKRETMVAYRFHSIEPFGLWSSEAFPAADYPAIVRGVIAGHLSGHARWATALDGTFIYGLNADGAVMSRAPIGGAS